jgi:hypothetical protein
MPAAHFVSNHYLLLEFILYCLGCSIAQHEHCVRRSSGSLTSMQYGLPYYYDFGF